MGPVRPIRGLFGRFDGVQSWGPGTHSSFRGFGRSWLESHFPEVRGTGRFPGRLGAVWIRWIEGRWFVCHACVPEWSSDRTIPAWAISAIDHGDMSSVPCLAAAVEDVTAAVRSPSSWAGSIAHYGPLSGWGNPELAALAALFDASNVPSGPESPAGIRIGSAMLDAPGWTALQAILVAMQASGVDSPCAVHVLEHGWDGSLGHSVPSNAFVSSDGPSVCGAPMALAALQARGVGIIEFAPDLPSAHALVVSLAQELGEHAAATPFVELAGQFVPLELIDPGRIQPYEVRDWAASVARASATGSVLADRVEALTERIAQGEVALLPHLLALAAEWVDASGPGDRSGGQRLETWIGRALRMS